jgi:hypothetical protein
MAPIIAMPLIPPPEKTPSIYIAATPMDVFIYL